MNGSCSSLIWARHSSVLTAMIGYLRMSSVLNSSVPAISARSSASFSSVSARTSCSAPSGKPTSRIDRVSWRGVVVVTLALFFFAFRRPHAQHGFTSLAGCVILLLSRIGSHLARARGHDQPGADNIRRLAVRLWPGFTDPADRPLTSAATETREHDHGSLKPPRHGLWRRCDAGENLMYCFIGALLGTLVGVLPGIGPTATIAMLLPLTCTLSPTASLIMLAGIYGTTILAAQCLHSRKSSG